MNRRLTIQVWTLAVLAGIALVSVLPGPPAAAAGGGAAGPPVVQKNQPPRPDAGGPYRVDITWPTSVNEQFEFDFVTLDHTGSSDPDGTIAKYEWDLNFDGTYDLQIEGSPKTGVFNKTLLGGYLQGGASGDWEDRGPLVAVRHTKLAPRIRLRVTDNRGQTATATAEVPRYGWALADGTSSRATIGNVEGDGQAITPVTLDCPPGYLAQDVDLRHDPDSPWERIIGLRITCREVRPGSPAAIFGGATQSLTWGSQQSLVSAIGGYSASQRFLTHPVNTRTRSAAPERGALRAFEVVPTGLGSSSFDEFFYTVYPNINMAYQGEVVSPPGATGCTRSADWQVGVVAGIQLYAAEAVGPDNTVWIRGIRLRCRTLEREQVEPSLVTKVRR